MLDEFEMRFALKLPLMVVVLAQLFGCGGGSGGGDVSDTPSPWLNVKIDVQPARIPPGGMLFVELSAVKGALPDIGSLPDARAHSDDGGTESLLSNRAVYTSEHTATVALKVPDQLIPGRHVVTFGEGPPSTTAFGGDSFEVVESPHQNPLVVVVDDGGDLVARNDALELRIDGHTGWASSLRANSQDFPISSLLEESLELNDGGTTSFGRGARLRSLTIEESTPFYARIVIQHAAEGAVTLERVIELTDGPHVVVTAYLRTEQRLAAPDIRWRTVFPEQAEIRRGGEANSLITRDVRLVRVPGAAELLLGKPCHDLQIEDPGVQSHLRDGLRGMRVHGRVEAEGNHHVEVSVEHGFTGDVDRDQQTALTLEKGQVFAMTRVWTVGNPSVKERSFYHDNLTRRLVRCSFYPRLGLLAPAVAGSSEGRFTFANWNLYENALELTPLHAMPQGARDIYRTMLLRMGTHLTERMEHDAGWPGWFAWHIYPQGERHSSHSRAFPFLAYLWYELYTSEGRRSLWVDRYYDALQETQPYFDEESPHHFVERDEQGKRYLGYATSVKHDQEPEVRYVANTHALALRFVHLMHEVSRVRMRDEHEAFWKDVGSWADWACETVFSHVYPAVDDEGQPLYGFLGYRDTDRRVIDLAYDRISAGGLARGMARSGRAPLELIEIVERSTEEIQLNSEGLTHTPGEKYLGNLYRAFPLTIAFAKNDQGTVNYMAGHLDHVSLEELVSPNRTLATHDPTQMIVVGDEQWVVRTNNKLSMYWTPGFFDEVPMRALSPEVRFRVRVVEPDVLSEQDVWVVAQREGRFEVTASFVGGIQIAWPEGAPSTITALKSLYRDHRWTPNQEIPLRSQRDSKGWSTVTVTFSPKDVWTIPR